VRKQCFTPEDVRVHFANTLPSSVISQAVRVSDARTRIHISGQVATDENGNVVAPDDLEPQIHQVFKNLDRVLRVSGATMKDVVATECIHDRYQAGWCVPNAPDAIPRLCQPAGDYDCWSDGSRGSRASYRNWSNRRISLMSGD
jgi:enamine deaminase RidA (YjgF/YER057c/UK114 family)